MPDVTVRTAERTDAAAIADIYNPYVTGSAATFDTEPVTEADRAAWIATHGPEHPVLVAEVDGEVVGWGSVSPWAPRPAWHRTVELSVYVHADVRGEGIGTALMTEMIERARAAGHHALMAQIVAGNEASLGMARRLGFEVVGVMREVGDKFGRWHDLVLVERVLRAEATP